MIMQVTSMFDSMAASYDTDFTHSCIGQLQRERVWSYLNPLLIGRSLKILEINCGTGEDALRLVAAGHQVVATDASAQMIEQANQKLDDNKSSQLSFYVCSFNQLKDQFAGQQFDLVFSNFGGLNCIDQDSIKQLSRDLAELTKPTGQLFFVMLSNCCLWETGYFGIRAKFKKAFRRFSGKAGFDLYGENMTVCYYSVKLLKKLMISHFELQQSKPIGLFVPPSYLEEKFSSRPKRLQLLNRLDTKFDHSIWSNFADHYCAVFKKQEVGS